MTITGWYNARFSELTKFLLKEIKRFVNHDSVLPKRHKYQNLVTVLRRGGGHCVDTCIEIGKCDDLFGDRK